MNCPGQQARRRRGALRRDARPERERYAAGKWGSAPAATALPPPPTHWRRETRGDWRDGRCRDQPDRALTLKLLLNVASA